MQHNKFLKIAKLPEEMTAEVQIDLSNYIRTYISYASELKAGGPDAKFTQVAKRLFDIVRNDLASNFSEFSTLWSDVFDTITQNNHLKKIQYPTKAQEEQLLRNEAIEQSAIFEVMQDGFGEIVKNVVDEMISKHLNSHQLGSNTNIVAKLRVSIDDYTNPDCVSVTFKDNGRGFNQNMLRLNDRQERLDYISSRGSPKTLSASETQLHLGGRGLGLRQIIAKIDEGGHLEPNGQISRVYYPPMKANFSFSNHKDKSGQVQGAVITITTEKKPLELKFGHDDEFDLSLSSPFTSLPSSYETNQPFSPDIRQQLKKGRDEFNARGSKISPISINTDFSDDEDSLKPK